MVNLTRIYTRTGDEGRTMMGDGSTVPKTDPRVGLMGAIDEANAAIGMARLTALIDLNAVLGRLQNQLFDLGADVCVGEKRAGLRITDADITILETEIDRWNEPLPDLTSFVLPGGTPAAAALHLARTITRRAEGLGWLAAETAWINPAALRYLNRLSDLLFVLARTANAGADVLWIPGGASSR